MQITVLGCGRWGSFIAWYLDHIGHEVALYGRPDSANMRRFIETRGNGLLTLPESVSLTTSLESAVRADVLVVSINAQNFRDLMRKLGRLQGKTLVLCMKGIEEGTLLRLSEVARQLVGEDCRVAVWLGPGHVQEFLAGIPNCMVLDSAHEETTHMMVDAFSSDLIRFYYGQDLLGNEVGAAAKNVIGIAAGILDGLHCATLKGALTARGAREVARLIDAMGGNSVSAYGLCHLGDYGATVYSEYSQNRRFGEAYVKGEPFVGLAEGVYTVRALVGLSKLHGVELPITEAVYDTLYHGVPPQKAVDALFARSLKHEF